MLTQINGLHHVTSIGSESRTIDRFWTRMLGLRRVKKTVNFDAPEVYHLYYGDELGRPGTAMTFFPFPDAAPGRRGTGEIGEVRLAIPEGTAGFWADRLDRKSGKDPFGAPCLAFEAPDGDRFVLVETDDPRPGYSGAVPADVAIRGFHSVAAVLGAADPTAELLRFMGYEEVGRAGDAIRFVRPDGIANVVDLIVRPDMAPATQGAGSVHHVAFSVANRARQLEVRDALTDAGFSVTPPIDRDYFWAIYFRTPGGVLFEVATEEPGFDRDEDRAGLGRSLKLPAQHAHLRAHLENRLASLD